jgi:hypothetical protein
MYVISHKVDPTNHHCARNVPGPDLHQKNMVLYKSGALCTSVPTRKIKKLLKVIGTNLRISRSSCMDGFHCLKPRISSSSVLIPRDLQINVSALFVFCP